MKGGLRWPLGKASSEDGYRVIEVCHVRATIYKNQTLRLRVRETDRFNERIGKGFIQREVIMMLKDINTKLQVISYLCACILESLLEVRLIVISLVVCRTRTLKGVVFWKCFEILLEPYGTSCIAMPILLNDVAGAIGFLFLLSAVFSYNNAFWVLKD